MLPLTTVSTATANVCPTTCYSHVKFELRRDINLQYKTLAMSEITSSFMHLPPCTEYMYVLCVNCMAYYLAHILYVSVQYAGNVCILSSCLSNGHDDSYKPSLPLCFSREIF